MKYKQFVNSNKLLFNLHVFISIILYYCSILISLIFKSINGSLHGTLLFSIVLYALLNIFSDTKPYNLYQLITFISESDDVIVSSSITSILTIIGFIVGAESVSNNLNRKIMSQMQLEVANELRQLHNDALDTFFSLNFYIIKVIKYIDILQSNNEDDEIIKIIYFDTNDKELDLHELQNKFLDIYKLFLKFDRKHTIVLTSLDKISNILEISKQAVYLATDPEPINFPDFFNDSTNSVIQKLKQCDINDTRYYYDKIDSLGKLIHNNLIDTEYEFRKHWIDFSGSKIFGTLDKYSNVKSMVLLDLEDGNEIISKYKNNAEVQQ